MCERSGDFWPFPMTPQLLTFYSHFNRLILKINCIGSVLFFSLSSRIDDTSSKKEKIYPLPHMYVIKDLVPVSKLYFFFCEVFRSAFLHKLFLIGYDSFL